ncbi:hypothetical protein RND71_006598 [Anisodus tanguticus]|uniref:Uncharacterized protein n=1 Tax=Anisodus tanguticus TaxID=243964 RepID=A0AAE1SWE6_9SOLA|nr:hypothetical protein RND71_006598 [Anisodus tanguticus]
MGSYQLLRSHQSDEQQVQNCFASSSCLCKETQRGCSKAQNCLLKILRIISTVPPHNKNTPTSPPSLNSEKSNECNGFAIDLNIGFNVPLESGCPVDGGWVSRQSTSSADEKSSVAGVSTVDVGKCFDDDGEEKSCKSDSSRIVIEKLQLENNGVSETDESKIGELKEQQGFMGLLIEAATLIFGDFQDEISKPKCDKSFKSGSNREKLKLDEDDNVAGKKQVKRRNYECTDEVMEDKSSYPLVRSKRGRIQVLPNKYRDSILEPLTPFSRIRSTIVPNRRRSK